MNGFYCPILRPGTSLHCNREAMYLIDGTALCYDHAREVAAEISDREPPTGGHHARDRGTVARAAAMVPQPGEGAMLNAGTFATYWQQVAIAVLDALTAEGWRRG